MTNKPDNPPAFPRAGDEVHRGMTLRDYFAGQVDVSVYTPLTTFELEHSKKPTVIELAKFIAEIRYHGADAMLAERAEK